MIVLNVNTDAVKAYTEKLARLNRSAFPVAVRGALNNAAFDVKQNTMLKSAGAAFTQRSPNFFKATSTVEMAKGFDVKNMQSRVGFEEGKAKSAGNKAAVSELEQQEHGTKIEDHSFTPLKSARVGNSDKKLVRANARLRRIKEQPIIFQSQAKGKTEGEKFAKSVAFAGKGGLVMGEYRGKKILWRVNSISRTDEGKFKLTGLYLYDKGHGVTPPKSGFMKTASFESGKKIDDYYIQQAEKQFAKALQ